MARRLSTVPHDRPGQAFFREAGKKKFSPIIPISVNASFTVGSNSDVRRIRVVVPWPDGLHLRPAAKLVQIAQKFRSQISVECRGKIVDPRSILNIIALCATMGTTLDLQATGEDEQDAATALEEVFSSSDGGGDSMGTAVRDKV